MREIVGRGIVKLVQGDTALVEVKNFDACMGCGAKFTCGLGTQKQGLLHARNVPHAAVGQRVGITESHGMITKLSLIQYGIPLLGFFLGVFIPYYLNLSISSIADELVLFCLGLVGLLLGGAVSRKWILRAAKRYAYFFNISVIYSEV